MQPAGTADRRRMGVGMNTERLDGNVIVITGGAGGMGKWMADDFAARGASIAVLDIKPEAVQAVADGIEAAGGKAIACTVDVTSKAQLEEAANKVEEAFGPITIWINSAGISHQAPYLGTSEELFDKTIAVNLKGTFLACQVALAKMLEHGGGVILNMASIAGKTSASWEAAYTASKHGVMALTKSIAKEFADQNIRVNALCPGIVPTEMWETLRFEYAKKRNLDPDEVLPRFAERIPMKRLVDRQDVINAALFLITDNSSYLTGQSINLVGGDYMD